MTRYAVGLGSNQGDRLGHLRAGVEGLESLAREEVVVSGIYETAPVGGPDQPPFLNAVAVFDAEMSPHELLDALHEIEDANGRVREEKWGPRTLDLDVVASDTMLDDSPILVIPHPRAIGRRFVLEPLVGVWPGAIVHTDGVSARDALPYVLDQEVDQLSGAQWRSGAQRGSFWVLVQMSWIVAIALAVVMGGTRPDWNPWRIAGAVVGALGLLILIWIGLTGEGFEEGVERGPYRWVRHPLYSSVVLLLVGLSLLTAAPIALGLSATLLYFFRLKAGYEESRVRLVDAAYRSYVERVRWWLIPGLE